MHTLPPPMQRIRALCLAFTTLVFFAGHATPQMPEPAPVPPSLVTSTGTATVYARPTHVAFTVQETVAADTLEAALKKAMTVEKSVRDYLTERQLRPTRLESDAPAVLAESDGPAVGVTIALEFSMAPFLSGESGKVKLGALCDQLRRYGEDGSRDVSGPHFVTSERNAVIQEAVGEAAKNALIAASGAAAALSATISMVDTIEVVEIGWNAPPDAEGAYPTVDAIACTAKTRVTYLAE